MKAKLLGLVSSSWFLAVFIGSCLFLLIPFHSYQMHFKLVDREMMKFGDPITSYVRDLDSDGYTEMIFLYDEGGNQTNVQVWNSLKGIKDQWNLYGEFHERSNLAYFGDIDNNGLEEIFIFTQKNDSIFLNWFEPYSKDDNTEKRKFIATIDYRNNEPSFYSSNAEIFDFNGDGFGEIVFALNAGLSLHPRKLFIYDFKNDSLKSGEQLGTFLFGLIVGDFDSDGKYEITGSTSASKNVTQGDSILFSDQSGWLLLFDQNFELVNPAVEFFKSFDQVIVSEGLESNNPNIVVLNYSRGDSPDLMRILKYNSQTGDTLTVFQEQPLEQNVAYYLNVISMGYDSVYCLSNSSGHLKILNRDFNVINEADLEHRISTAPTAWINSGKTAYLFWKNDLECGFSITNNQGIILDRVLVDPDNICGLTFHHFVSPREELLLVHAHRELYYYKPSINPFYYSKYLIGLAMIMAIWFFIKVIQKIQMKKMKDKAKLAKEMQVLQIRATRNQLDPHFTFNALNVLTFLSAQKDNEGVENFTHHFSRLLRRQIEMSDKPSVKLYDELRFVQHYVELQKLRFEQNIRLEEEVDSDVDMNLQVPKMMIHSHVENAIKHGLIPKEGGGEIKINIKKTKKGTEISIRDNGVGRSQINHNATSTGKGLAILSQLYDLFYQLFKVRISQTIIDLYDKDGIPSGTEVKIIVPG